MADKKTKNNKNPKQPVFVPTLRKLYSDSIIPRMTEKFNFSNIMEVPKLKSITLNMGIGDGKNNSKGLEGAQEELMKISGQKPVVTTAKKDISNFKIRKGWPVGCKVTLRDNRMFEFLERLICIALPRTRDFRGLSFKSFDGRGNYNFGVKEQIIFTEIDYDKIESIKGMNISISTTAKHDHQSYELLKLFGLPLRKKPTKTDSKEAL